MAWIAEPVPSEAKESSSLLAMGIILTVCCYFHNYHLGIMIGNVLQHKHLQNDLKLIYKTFLIQKLNTFDFLVKNLSYVVNSNQNTSEPNNTL